MDRINFCSCGREILWGHSKCEKCYRRKIAYLEMVALALLVIIVVISTFFIRNEITKNNEIDELIKSDQNRLQDIKSEILKRKEAEKSVRHHRMIKLET